MNIKRIRTLYTVVIASMLISAAFFAFIPTAAASTPTHAFLSVSPNPVGVNQEVSFLMWIDKFEPTSTGPSGGVWQDYKVVVTKPDGTTTTLGPFNADPSSFATTSYKPDKVGTYTLSFEFPGKQVTGLSAAYPPVEVNEYYEPSSFTTHFTVQNDPVAPLPQNPLPTGYWTRPINAQNHDWYTISGNWLGTGTTAFGNTYNDQNGNFNAYSKAPNSAHIVWKKPIALGGLIGGEYGSSDTSHFYTGKSYEPKFTPPVIINGVLYYNAPDEPKEGFYAVDLRTGETLWWQNSSGPVTQVGLLDMAISGYAGITCGQILTLKTPNEEGGRAYLWYMGPESGLYSPVIYKLYDAATGQLILSLTNALEGGARTVGPNGELLIYFLDAENSRLIMWNSTQAIWNPFGDPYANSWVWRPQVGATIDWQIGVQWNVIVPEIPGQAIYKIDSGVILATTGAIFSPQNWQMEAAYNAETGESLWVANRTTPAGATQFGLMGPLKDGIYAEFDKGAMQWTGFNAFTGEQIWGPTTPYPNAWDSLPQDAVSAYGNIYHPTVGGIHALTLATGAELWTFNSDPTLDFPGFSNLPFIGALLTVADGKVFAPTGTSHGSPSYRGAKLYAIDAFSGKEVWSINFFCPDAGTMPVADGYLVAFNGYDNSLYCFGQGLTATTVTAAPGVGNTVTVQGTVTDQSLGQTCFGIPAKGTPAISDSSITAWMEYLYMQKPKPSDATGVAVEVKATSSTGQTTSLGTVVSDSKGQFKLAWTPSTNDLYTITATFAGSSSYFSSEGQTAVSVSGAAIQQTNLTTESVGMYILAATVLIIVAIAIVAVLILRKRA